jgi:hypothetical protein
MSTRSDATFRKRCTVIARFDEIMTPFDVGYPDVVFPVAS